jgi:hypothetical protein
MSGQSLDAEASETVAGVVRLPRRAAELVWVAIDTDTETAGFHRQLLALGIDLAAGEDRGCVAVPDRTRTQGDGAHRGPRARSRRIIFGPGAKERER